MLASRRLVNIINERTWVGSIATHGLSRGGSGGFWKPCRMFKVKADLHGCLHAERVCVVRCLRWVIRLHG
jgi:hypothetical protein